jgi:hypothetical protein
MMKYLLLVYRDQTRWDSMSAGERAAFEVARQASEQDLIRSHSLIGIQLLQSNTALTLRIVDGSRSVTDGPILGGQEQLTEFLLIQARDLNAAVQIASQMPQARAGPIEVRPIVE